MLRQRGGLPQSYGRKAPAESFKQKGNHIQSDAFLTASVTVPLKICFLKQFPVGTHLALEIK